MEKAHVFTHAVKKSVVSQYWLYPFCFINPNACFYSNHPYMLPNSEPEPYMNGPHLLKSSGKLMVLSMIGTIAF